MNQIYINIRELRQAHGWSQGELAKRAGYKDRSAFAHIEDGSTDLPLSKIILFAEIFNISCAELLGNTCLGTDGFAGADSRLVHAFHSVDPITQGNVRLLLGIKEE